MSILFAAMTIGASVVPIACAKAQEDILPAAAGPISLWRDLQFGDTPEAALLKLQSMPEIKRVKNVTKKGSFADQDINMNNGGVRIFDGHFSVTTGYKSGSLIAVQLTSGIGCVDQGHPLASKIEAELEKKYPDVVERLVDATTLKLVALDATSQEPTSTTSVYRNDDVTVFLRVHFFMTDAPQYYGGSNLNRSLYNLQRTLYEQRANACGGTGYRTAQISIRYITRSEYDRMVDQIIEERAEDRKEAAENL